VLKLVPDDAGVTVSVGLNLIRLNGAKDKLAQLTALSVKLPSVAQHKDRARYAINLGMQAAALGPQGLELAYRSFDSARNLAEQADDTRLAAEALDQLAQLYENQHRNDEALRLSEQGVLAAQATQAHDLLLKLEWRRGRLLRLTGMPAQAIAAYQRAVDHIEAIRQDIPVEYQDGRSSFRETLEPVYLGLADLLLQQSSELSGKDQSAQLRRARNTLELLKQTELEDFLGDRCSVDSVRTAVKEEAVAPHTAVLYPIILPERLELLLETSSGLQRATVQVSAQNLRSDATRFASSLRAAQSFQVLAKRLYDRLLRPFDAAFQREQIETLVVVPDGVLRLLPFGALHDGQRFAVQKYAIAVVPGLSMTNTQARSDGKHNVKTLLAGMSEPGDVVEKLPEPMVKQLLTMFAQTGSQSGSRGIAVRGGFGKIAAESDSVNGKADGKPAAAEPIEDKEKRDEKLKKILALSGVKDEIESLSKLGPSETLLNQGFSVNAFSEQVTRGDFGVVHIASHGVFGGSADSTFIMAHDDVITIDKLQSFLRRAGQHDHPIELLTLSACETAEGDDRAPLGLSGAALKARAKTALGSLWPVADEAAKILMNEFYRNLQQADVGKAQALRAAQLKLIGNRNFAHPFFWAPFIVVGSWQ
jgi:CHAT domain-containing protein